MDDTRNEQASLPAQGPVFVVGAPRTGTTLTMEILNNHPLIHIYDEVHYNERIADTIPNRGRLSDEQLIQATTRLLEKSDWQPGVDSADKGRNLLAERARNLGGGHAAVFEAFLAGEAGTRGKSIWGDSSPQDILYINRLKRWYPGAKFIGVVRDPRGFLASYKNYYRKGLRTYRNRFNPLANSLLWRSYMQALSAGRDSLPAGDIHILHYEELVSAPEAEVKRLCDFLDVPFAESMLAVDRQNSSYFSVQDDHKQQGISAGSIDRWTTELSAVEIRLVQNICGESLRRFGYNEVQVRLGVRDLGEMLRILLLLPGRLFNLLFRTGKPLTTTKLKKVLGRAR